VISGFRREVDENCALLDYYAYSSGNFMPTLKPETSVRNNHYSLRSNPEERSSHFMWDLNAHKSRNRHLAVIIHIILKGEEQNKVRSCLLV
jgi:hypothetical protein